MRIVLVAVAIAMVVFGVVVSGRAAAHDFWIDLDAYQFDGNMARPNLAFLEGHATDSHRWPWKRERVVSFGVYGRGFADLRMAINPQPGARTEISFSGAGAHVISFESTPVINELAADKFNAYLEEEGLTAVREWRRINNAESAPGREIYSRRAKAIVLIGEGPGAHVTKPIGHTLEIVPENNPYALGANEPLIVRVYYRGAPIAGVLVHFESLSAGLLPEVRKTTGEDGRASFKFPNKGAWKLVAVWSEPIMGRPGADFETVFSSLTFGYAN